MTSIPAKTALFVVFPGVKLLDLAGPMQVFADARQVCGQNYDLLVASLDGGEIASDAALPVATRALSTLRDRVIDTLIVAGGPGAFDAARDAALLQHIRHFAAGARRIGSVCTGAFVLAGAGLLDGRRAVTHWEYCDLLRDTYPGISVQPDAIFVQDCGIWTSAGVTAGIDMSLAMLAEDAGRKPALALARSLVCYMVRPGGQSQFSAALQLQDQSASGRFDALNAWVADSLKSDHTVENLAARAGMSPRNFARLYKAHTGVSPARAVETIRLTAACRLLEDTDWPIGRIATHCGFGDDERLRRAMMRALKVAPGEFRQRFGTPLP